MRKDCLNGINFYPLDIVYAEDELFNIKILKQDLKIGYVNKSFYHYMLHGGSITSFIDKNVVLARIKEIEILNTILDRKIFDDFFELKKRFYTICFLLID